MIHNQVFIAFVDCTIKGNWRALRPTPGFTALVKQAIDDNCTVNIFQINVVRRYLSFKKDAIIDLIGNVILYNAYDVEEITIDEYEAYNY